MITIKHQIMKNKLKIQHLLTLKIYYHNQFKTSRILLFQSTEEMIWMNLKI